VGIVSLVVVAVVVVAVGMKKRVLGKKKGGFM